MVQPQIPRPRMWSQPIHPPFFIILLLDTSTPFCHHPSWSRSPVCPHGNRYFPPLGGAQHSRCHATQLGSAPTCCGVHVLRKGRSDFDPPAQACSPPPSPTASASTLHWRTYFIRPETKTEFRMLVLPIQSRRRALAVTNENGTGKVSQTAAVQRRRHAHPGTRRDDQQNWQQPQKPGQRAPLPPAAALVAEHSFARRELPHDWWFWWFLVIFGDFLVIFDGF